MSNASVSGSKIGFVVFSALACALLALPAVADSQARIVRLSDVQGSVQIDKNTGMGFESAFLNLPITQGTQIRTRNNGRAEIEFEDGSTMRLTPNTQVQFSTLGLDDSGKHLSVVDLVDGMAYVNWMSKSDEFTLNFSREKVVIGQPAHFRVETSPTLAKFAVFKGDVEVAGPAGKVMVGKKKMVTFDASNEDKYEVAKNLEEGPLDSWDKESIEYHQQYAKNSSSPFGYGASDLGYYGNYTNLPGYGMMWQPFFTGAGWDPFMDGAWSFYPGYGFMYISAYPWGWLPYRYGNWMFVPGFGWMWQPGYWTSWNTVPRYVNTTAVRFHAPVAPTAGTVGTVVVGRGGPGVSTVSSTRLVVNRGSAGIGIARGSLSNLNRVNNQVAKSGSVEVHSAPSFATTSSARSAAALSSPRGTSRSSTGSAAPSRSAGAAPAGHASPSGGHHN